MGPRSEIGTREGLEGIGVVGVVKKPEELMFTEITNIKIK